MSKHSIVTVLLGGLLGLGLCASPAPALENNMTLAYIGTGLKELNNTDKQVALQILAKELTKNVDTELRVTPLNSMRELLDLASTGKLNYSLINSYFYISHIEQLRPLITDEIWAAQRGQELGEDYVLIVNNDVDYKDIRSLSGKRLSTFTDDLLMGFYLEQLIKREANTSPERFFKAIKDTRTLSQSVLDVYFKTSDACLVPSHIVDLVTELNPAVKQGIKIVHHSGADFIMALILVFKNNPDTEANAIRGNLQQLPNSIAGQQILDLFHIKTITRIQPESLDGMLSLYQQYRENQHKKNR
ncbi:phosphate/phosphite/phosphonate ABC transporter substrate-binding protein [Methylomonas sp. SURF-2]|uniref:Phosphate/phosphite/phosphonate ABC transporter substrate-binding protein n=1 Tax=Methylomonas subterranea TaxID=2952225 RepID=A0ABT1TJG5_9GAMM|nr:PhnD/SsuA/transferrin family substrate-binding protein [Methylomonas sp. SURF-2]MCQ8105459.1 phosphate/phosphite/phosphonate ABC transporter substrate-binding protein [Methylomonas sp. SURF-2]